MPSTCRFPIRGSPRPANSRRRPARAEQVCRQRSPPIVRLACTRLRVMTRLGVSSSVRFLRRRLTGGVADEGQHVAGDRAGTESELRLQRGDDGERRGSLRFRGAEGAARRRGFRPRGIDSKLDAVLIIADAAGRDLLVERRSGTLDFTVPQDGRYVIKVHELTFQGGPAYFYRLALRELPADAPCSDSRRPGPSIRSPGLRQGCGSRPS